MVKLGIAPSEFWAMSFPELVAMINMHVKAQKAAGSNGKAKMTPAEEAEHLAFLRGEIE